jgi:mRNA interferase MazF
LVVQRGEVWWAGLDDPRGSEPGYRRPVLVVQADAFNRSRLRTVLCVVLTSHIRLLNAPGNVLLPSTATGLPRDSVANMTQLITLDKEYLTDRVSKISTDLMGQVADGLRLVLEI